VARIWRAVAVEFFAKFLERKTHLFKRAQRVKHVGFCASASADWKVANAGRKGQWLWSVVERALFNAVDRRRSNKPKSCESVHGVSPFRRQSMAACVFSIGRSRADLSLSARFRKEIATPAQHMRTQVS
jgi:hypothetical protein